MWCCVVWVGYSYCRPRVCYISQAIDGQEQTYTHMHIHTPFTENCEHLLHIDSIGTLACYTWKLVKIADILHLIKMFYIVLV